MADLMEKIQVCVSYDLIGNGKLVAYEDMSEVVKKRFVKQCERLFHVCSRVERDAEYINERYESILSTANFVNGRLEQPFYQTP